MEIRYPIFEPDPYFYNITGKDNSNKISYYNFCFKNGILICPQLLYYLIIGSYSQASRGKFILKKDENKGYITLNILLEYIKSNTKQTLNLFITPHIFTKFINLLKIRKIDNNNYKKILDLFKEEFNYIKEEEIKKEEIIDFSNFRNQIIGVSETVLLLLKERKKEPCILSINPKILEGFKSDFLYVDFKEMITFIENHKRKSE